MECKICNSSSRLVFKAQVLSRYQIAYFHCVSCGFIQTEKPYWLEEAYSSAISSLDVGLVSRNLELAESTVRIITQHFEYGAKFLDYAGGYGLFVRLMRDRGFDFYRQDVYCENIFARSLDVQDLLPGTRFELVTAFEVFEHLVNPIDEIQTIFTYADSILFSTELQPHVPINSVKDWWYFVPESGQHVSLYTRESLEIIAKKFNCFLYTDNAHLHLMTPKSLAQDPFAYQPNKESWLYRGLNRLLRTLESPASAIKKPIQRESLLNQDFEMARKKVLLNKPR